MRFLRLGMKNFGPYKGEQWLEFPTNDDAGVMVVFGDNMRGKTSLLNALRWALYGTALDRRSRPMDFNLLLNKEAAVDGDWEFWVSLHFIANGVTYELRRHAQPADQTVRPKRSRDFAVKVTLREDGNFSPADDVERKIDQFIPEDISRFYLFDGELLREYEELLVEDSETGEAIKTAIEQVLGIPALVNGRDELKVLLKRAQAVQARETKHVEALQAHARQSLQLQEELETHEEDLTDLRGREEGIVDELHDIQDQLDGFSGVAAKQERERILEEQKENTEKDLDNLRVQKHTVLQGAWRDIVQPRLQSKLDDLSENIEEHEELLRSMGALEERERQLKELLDSDQCPVCESPLESADREQLGARLGEIEVEMTSRRTSREALTKLGGEMAILSKVQPTGATDRLRDIDERRNALAVQLTKVEEELDEIGDYLRNHDVARVAQLRSKKDGLLKLRGKLSTEIQDLERKIDEKNKKLRQLSKLMSRNPEGRKQRSTREVEILTELGTVFGDGIHLLRERMKATVEEEATKAFLQLTTEPNYQGLRINRNYGLRILDGSGDEVPVRSAGAEQVVAMSLLAALNTTAARRAPVVVDTPFGRLDPKHRRRILEFVPKLAEQVVFLVHEGEIQKEGGLAPIRDSVGRVYEITRVSETHSALKATGDE